MAHNHQRHLIGHNLQLPLGSLGQPPAPEALPAALSNLLIVPISLSVKRGARSKLARATVLTYGGEEYQLLLFGAALEDYLQLLEWAVLTESELLVTGPMAVDRYTAAPAITLRSLGLPEPTEAQRHYLLTLVRHGQPAAARGFAEAFWGQGAERAAGEPSYTAGSYGWQDLDVAAWDRARAKTDVDLAAEAARNVLADWQLAAKHARVPLGRYLARKPSLEAALGAVPAPTELLMVAILAALRQRKIDPWPACGGRGQPEATSNG